MRKKRICLVLAVLVSVCCLVCLISTAAAVTAAVRNGGSLPIGMVLLTLATALCAGMIWKGFVEMED